MKEFNFNVKDRTLTLNGGGKFIGHNGDYIAVSDCRQSSYQLR